MKVIQTNDAPSPIGPYSQAVMAANTLYISGQIAIEPQSGDIILEDIKKETMQVMENIKAILSAAGLGFENVVKCSIFLSDMNNFQQVNEIYGKYFEKHHPARETIAVAGLPKDVNVEISVIAVKD
ncbi:MAG: RidA family protein [Bacteroidia bacterium]